MSPQLLFYSRNVVRGIYMIYPCGLLELFPPRVLSFLHSMLVCSYNSCWNLICRNCIIDKNARIGNNVIIANKDVSNNLVVKVLYFWKFFLLFLMFYWGKWFLQLVNEMFVSLTCYDLHPCLQAKHTTSFYTF